MGFTNNQAIKVHYDGAGTNIRSHRMRANFVSNSISGFDTIYCEAYKEANRIYKSQIETQLLLEGGLDGSFKDGSIWWLLKLFTSETESQQSIEKKSITRSVISSIHRAICILKQMDLSTTEILIKNTDDGFEVNIDGENVILDELQCAILTNPKIRRAISDIASPLSDDEIDTLVINHGVKGLPSTKITKKDKDNLIIKRTSKHIVDSGKTSGFYYVEDLSYNPKSTWKLIPKDTPKERIKAYINDPVFLKRVSDNEEKFSKDDLLEVELVWYKEKNQFTGTTSINYTITSVKEHIPAEDKQWKLL